jgi:hypothetical protein
MSATQILTDTREIFIGARRMARGSIPGLTGRFTTGSGRKVSSRVTEFGRVYKGIPTLVSGHSPKLKDMGYTSGKMGTAMKVSGLIV